MSLCTDRNQEKKERSKGDSSSGQVDSPEEWEMGQLVKHCPRRVCDDEQQYILLPL